MVWTGLTGVNSDHMERYEHERSLPPLDEVLEQLEAVTANGIGLSSYGDQMVKQLLDYTGSLRPVRWVVGWTEFMKLIISTMTPVTIEQKTLR